MKLRHVVTALAVCMLAATARLAAQDIETRLSGKTDAQHFLIRDSDGKLLFTLTGNGMLGLGTQYPDSRLEALSSDYLVFPIHGVTDAVHGSGVKGWARAKTGVGRGLQGQADADQGIGVLGHAFHSAGTGIGVQGLAESTGATGVQGYNISSTNLGALGMQNYGVYGKTTSPAGWGGYFEGRGYFSDKLGLGVTDPDAMLHVNGQVKISGGAPGAGKVLTSDADGLATWEASSGGSGTLDQAYDQGGAGAGRTITADAGAVTVAGVDGFLVTGTFGNGTIPATGEGSRMMFYPNKAAFRAGYSGTVSWDDANIGQYSTAMCHGTNASGQSSTAMGYFTSATGSSSTAMGINTTATGSASTAMGGGTLASGSNSTAMGGSTRASGVSSTAMGGGSRASGENSTAMGLFTKADSYCSFALGQYNVGGGGSGTTWIATDPVFEIGIGSSDGSRNNAMTVLKNGNVGIGTATPAALLTTIGTGVNHGWGAATISSTLGSSQGGSIELGGANATTHIANPVSGGTPYIDFHYGTGSAQDYNARIINEGDKMLNVQIDGTNAATMQKAGGEGRLGVNVNGTLQYTLYVNGSAAKPGGGNWTNPSDGRLKTVVGPYRRGLRDILGLQPIRFQYKPGNTRQMPSNTEEIGFIAQDVQPLFPESVSEGRDGYLDFNMHAVNVALVNAVKELHAELQQSREQALETSAALEVKSQEVSVLRGEVDALRSELRDLRTAVLQRQDAPGSETAAK